MGKEDIELSLRQKIFKGIFWGAVIFCLCWMNYSYFSRHTSSNPERINNFILIDNNINKFRIPVTAGFFYPYSMSHKSKVLSSQTNPKIFVVPYDGYLYSQGNVAKAYARLLPWRDRIKNVFFILPTQKNEEIILHRGNIAPFANSQEINSFLFSNLKVPVKYQNLSQEKILQEQLPLLKKTFLNTTNLIVIKLGKGLSEDLAKSLLALGENNNTLIIGAADMSEYYTEKEKNKNQEVMDLVVELAQHQHLYPKVFDLVNFEDVEEQNYRLVESKISKLNTLEQEVESLRSFAYKYGQDLMKIAKLSLDSAVINKQIYKPSRADWDDSLFNKGVSYVILKDKENKIKGMSGSTLSTQAIAFDVANNTYMAASGSKDYPPISQDELSDIKISINLLSGFEKLNYRNEVELLAKINQNVDGILLQDGNRQGIFLPQKWQEFPQKRDFLSQLKVSAGLSPSYWSNRIKVYRFRTVEVTINED